MDRQASRARPGRPAEHANLTADIQNPMKPTAAAALALIAALVWAIPAAADWTAARCEPYEVPLAAVEGG